MKKSMRKMQQVAALTLAVVAMMATIGVVRASAKDRGPWLPGRTTSPHMWLPARPDVPSRTLAIVEPGRRRVLGHYDPPRPVEISRARRAGSGN